MYSMSEPEKQPKLLITVLARQYFAQLVEAYCGSCDAYPPCEIHREGQRFAVQDLESCPEGFCEYAWGNIAQEMRAALQGEQLPWVCRPHTFVACCTDGLRPVVFEIVLQGGGSVEDEGA